MEKYSVRQLNYLTERYSVERKLQEDKDATLAVVKRSPSLVQFASLQLQNDLDVALAVVRSDGRALRFLNEKMRSQEEVVLPAVENFCASFAFAMGEAKESFLVAKAVAKRGGDVIELLNEKFLDNEEIAKLAIERNAKSLRFFSERVRSLEEIVLLAHSKDRTSILYASDQAFKSRKVFEKAVCLDAGRGKILNLNNSTPLGVFDEIERRNISFSLAIQGFDYMTLDRDKLLVCLKCGEGAIVKKGELLRKYVIIEDTEVVSLIIEKCSLPHKTLLAEIKFASENRKIRVLPLLLRATKGLGEKDCAEKSERMYLMRSLRRKSPSAILRFKENYARYLSDREVVLLCAEADGTIIKTLENTDYLKDEQFVTSCLKSYVVKNSDGALLDGLKVDLTPDQALIACQKDGRNYFYLKDEYKKIKQLAIASVRSNEEVYDNLCQEFKDDAEIIKEKRLWLR